MLLHANRQSEAALQTYDTTVSRFGKTDTLDVIKAEILVDLDRKEEAETTLMPWFRENSGIRQVYSTLGYLYLDKKNVKIGRASCRERVKSSAGAKAVGRKQ